MSTGGVSLLAQFFSAGARFANRRGIYAGRRFTKVHVRCYRWSNGRIGGHIPGRRDARILLLDHVGAKSGVRRTSPLVYITDGAVTAVAASKAGQPTHPAWLHNLLAQPHTTIQLGARSCRVRVRLANASEREQLWRRFVETVPDYKFYQQHGGPRTIPIVILEPR
ncbi:nitroreductase/quinone reductase family protein [Nocardia goodfellowii]|uniref:Deazaflavin-dependent oxidoreductase (Nitroreductase family) n=1 Tax=Nocardia goodfellowii TaxID=882446 RepID=A0ABS4QN85_9NOCA|nr:nitroreductase/quinone reductase family protein [Nocardia goodfellowii]MBP2192131.1 deazaflavin-dependent oxidoreductase (nitroreductase family) [Nocardia goodfellowii]